MSDTAYVLHLKWVVSERSVTYDQATNIYATIARRRRTRFQTQGRLPGCLCLVSAKGHPKDFTETRIQEARDPGPNTRVLGSQMGDHRSAGLPAEADAKDEALRKSHRSAN